ncbi:MAG TPA: hypothetical protein VGS97_11535 [Actinocrinis sp.]|nr:hypothetical protein [Actinocrinis sp.]
MVQTAVLGSPDSAEPVILPTDHDDLDAFRTHYAGSRFWCGELLGGCGRELVSKKYADRLCHFAHVADSVAGPSTCSRGAHSADHLYVRRAARTWLHGLGYQVEGELRGAQHDEAVDFQVPGGPWLRFQLRSLTAEQWEQEDARARKGGRPITWFLPRSDEAEDASFETENPALLMRVEADGTTALPERRVEIGTRSASGQVHWDRLEDCGLDEQGRMQTPTLRTHHRRAPVRRLQTQAVDTEPSEPWHPPVPQPRVRAADSRPPQLDEQQAQRVALLAEAADVASHLRHECRTRPVNLAYLRILLDNAVALDERVRESGPHDQALIDAIARARAALEVAAQSQSIPQAAFGPYTAHQPQPDEPLATPFGNTERELPESISVLAHAAKQALIAAAREGICLSWPQLCRRMNRPKLARADAETVFEILRIADYDPANQHRPLLSALLTESDPPRRSDAFMRIATEHGQHVPTSAARRSDMRSKEIEAVYAHWPSVLASGTSTVPER